MIDKLCTVREIYDFMTSFLGGPIAFLFDTCRRFSLFHSGNLLTQRMMYLVFQAFEGSSDNFSNTL